MHPTQLEILDSLRQSDSRKFSELLSDAAETSDNLTYHLKRLLKDGLIESPAKGEYSLAEKGIIYLNNNLELNHDLFPTVSCMLELCDSSGNVLVMKKLKQPFLGSLHLPTFGVISDATLEEQIGQFLDKYQIEATDLTLKCNYRERVLSEGLFIFDKLFMVYKGSFASFVGSVEDREFLTLPKSDLIGSATILPASKAVLGLDSGGYFEATRRQD